MANLIIPITSVPSYDPQGGSKILDSINRGSLKFVPQHFWHLPFTFKDFTPSGAVLTDDLTVSTTFPNRKFPANVYVKIRVIVDILVEFSGGAIATAVLDAGNAGDLDGIVDNLNVFTGAGTGIKNAINSTGTDLYGFQAALNLTITLTTTVANLDQLDAGSAIIYVVCEAVPRTRG